MMNSGTQSPTFGVMVVEERPALGTCIHVRNYGNGSVPDVLARPQTQRHRKRGTIQSSLVPADDRIR